MAAPDFNTNNVFSNLDEGVNRQIYNLVKNSERETYDTNRRDVGRYINRLSQINSGAAAARAAVAAARTAAKANDEGRTLTHDEALRQAQESYYNEHVRPIHQTIVQLAQAHKRQTEALQRYNYMSHIWSRNN